ncbi:hypothetical protein O181_078564 [Austropuccinia psidii MF-1]|uniref:CAP-Gly domain-containing protein n=1 Tax=Austropuccinia psidii MF-1 TaxID=1389203 RepID=A0A9Q3FH62_9BASI|nr:hypothetical protein [Austropuccinia psidii MF-1]
MSLNQTSSSINNSISPLKLNNNYNLNIEVGDRVKCTNSMVGICKYKGKIENKVGIWIGIDLGLGVEEVNEENWFGKGKNSGIVNGKTYFDCQPNCGIFFPISKVFPFPIKNQSQSNKSLTSSNHSNIKTHHHLHLVSPPINAQNRSIKSSKSVSKNQSSNQSTSNSCNPDHSNLHSTPRSKIKQINSPQKSLNTSNSIIKSFNNSSSNLSFEFNQINFVLSPTNKLTSTKLNSEKKYLFSASNSSSTQNSLSKSINSHHSLKRTSISNLPNRSNSANSRKRAESFSAHRRKPSLIINSSDWLKPSHSRPKSRLSQISNESKSTRDEIKSSLLQKSLQSQSNHHQLEISKLNSKIQELQQISVENDKKWSEINQDQIAISNQLELKFNEAQEKLNSLEIEHLNELEKIKSDFKQNSELELDQVRHHLDKLNQDLKSNQEALNLQISQLEHEKLQLQDELDQIRSAGHSLCSVYEEKVSNLENQKLEQLHESNRLMEELESTKLALQEIKKEQQYQSHILAQSPHLGRSIINQSPHLEAVEIDNERLKADLKYTKECLSVAQDEAYQLKQELETERESHEQLIQSHDETVLQHKQTIKKLKEDNSELKKENEALQFKLSQVEARFKETLETMEQERVELEGLRDEFLVSHSHQTATTEQDRWKRRTLTHMTDIRESPESQSTTSKNTLPSNHDPLMDELQKELRTKTPELQLNEPFTYSHQISMTEEHLDKDILTATIVDQEKMLVIDKYQRLILLKDEENVKLRNRNEELQDQFCF